MQPGREGLKGGGWSSEGRLHEEGGESLYDGTSRPIEAWLVEDYLRIQYRIEDAWLLPWKSRQKPGLSRPFGEPEVAHG